MKKNTSSFIKECLTIRGDKYDYSLVDYINNKKKVKIICKEHGIFEQSPNNHLSKLQDCPKCSPYHFELKNTEDVIKEFKLKHENKYDYSKVDYKNNKVKIEIICPEHGSFFQTPNNHLRGQDCYSCKKINLNDIIKSFNIIHNNKYDYSKVIEYTNCRKKIEIICPEHGSFFQVTNSHKSGVGCPNCCDSKGERDIKKILQEKKITYINEYTFEGCYLKKKLRFDFFLPEKNICIEYDGMQHFKSVNYFGGDTALKITKKRDKIKNDFCDKNGIKLVRIKFNDNIKIKLIKCLS